MKKYIIWIVLFSVFGGVAAYNFLYKSNVESKHVIVNTGEVAVNHHQIDENPTSVTRPNSITTETNVSVAISTDANPFLNGKKVSIAEACQDAPDKSMCVAMEIVSAKAEASCHEKTDEEQRICMGNVVFGGLKTSS